MYSVIATGSTTQSNGGITGTGTTSFGSMVVSPTNGITFTITRVGSEWCTSSSGGCLSSQQGAYPCLSSYKCPASVPKYSGNLQVNGSTFLSWSAGFININSQQGYATGLSQGNVVTLTINEN